MNYKYDIIALVEVWINDSEKNLFKILGYSAVLQERPEMHAGGVIIHFRTDLQVSYKSYATGSHEAVLLTVQFERFNPSRMIAYRSRLHPIDISVNEYKIASGKCN